MTDTALAVVVMTADEARLLTETIRTCAEGIADQLEDLTAMVNHAREGGADVALGYPSWPAYLTEVVGTVHTETRDERRVLVQYLSEQGLSTRAIAPILGVHKDTIRNDLASSGGELSPPDVIDAEPEPAALPITGLDGKAYRRPTPPVDVWSSDEEALRTRLVAGQSVVVSLREHHRHLVAWAEQSHLLIRIDRRTAWGNPFEIPLDGDRATVITKYRKHYLPNKPSLLADLPNLAGKALACWCAPQPCHGDVLAAGVSA